MPRPVKTVGVSLRLALMASIVVWLIGAFEPARAQMSVGDYMDISIGVMRGDKASGDSLSLFLGGLWNAVVASEEANVARGAPRRLCLPQKALPQELAIAIDEEIERKGDLLDKEPQTNIGVVAIAAIKQRWPCR